MSPLKLSSAIITADHDLASSRLTKVSISALVLREFEIVLATTGDTRPAERLELRVNPIMLSVLPDVLHLSGRGDGAHTLTLTFSDEASASMSWSTTFEVPRADSGWRLTVPFSHSPTPTE
ncbi:hypothetical protein [Lentzea sp. NPDC051838]|uniref:hypothetical protein n=1 Tax=Lentzea sp. NPDC051838 TaxID=3154849 RepID=UPI003427CBA0